MRNVPARILRDMSRWSFHFAGFFLRSASASTQQIVQAARVHPSRPAIYEDADDLCSQLYLTAK